MYLAGRPPELAAEKIYHERPDQLGELRLIAVRFGGREAVISMLEEMPFKPLAIGHKTLHDALLHVDGAGGIVAAVEHHRRAFDFARRITRVARPYARRLLVSHGWIVGDERPHLRSGGYEVNADPAAHAVADRSGPRGIDVAPPEKIAPSRVDDAHEISVGSFILNLRPRMDMSYRRIAEQMIQIRHD